MLDKIVESCQFLLDNYPVAQASKSYLDNRLQIESQRKWGFGYFPDIQNLPVLTDLVGEESLLENELLATSQIEDSLSPRRVMRDYFEDHPLIMPQRDTYGEIVALIGRTLLPEPIRQARKLSKYKNTHFKKGNYLFGLFENKQSILDQGCVYIVEGQFDVIKAGEVGFTNIVAIGNNNMSSYQFSLIIRYTNNIFLLLDNDIAGNKGRNAIINKYGSLANIHNMFVPENYKDIDEYISTCCITKFSDMSFLIKE